MTKIFVPLLLFGIVQLSPAQTDIEFKQRIAASLPSKSRLAAFVRLHGVSRAMIAVMRPEDDYSGEIDVSLVALEKGGIKQLGKPFEGSYDLVKPIVTSLDVDQDGTAEIVLICNMGGAHAYFTLDVVKASVSGVKDLILKQTLDYGWKILKKPTDRKPEFIADSSTYLEGEVYYGSQGKPLRIVYGYQNGAIRKISTTNLGK